MRLWGFTLVCFYWFKQWFGKLNKCDWVSRHRRINVLMVEIFTDSAKYFYRRLDIEIRNIHTVYPKKYAHGFCFAVLCCGYTLTDFPISIRLTSLALWQSNDCPSASKATLMNMDKYFMWIHYERLHKHNKAKHNKTVCIFLGIYCINSPVFLVSSTVGGKDLWNTEVQAYMNEWHIWFK